MQDLYALWRKEKRPKKMRIKIRNKLDRRGDHNPSTQIGRFSPGDDMGRISTGKEVISVS